MYDYYLVPPPQDLEHSAQSDHGPGLGHRRVLQSSSSFSSPGQSSTKASGSGREPSGILEKRKRNYYKSEFLSYA